MLEAEAAEEGVWSVSSELFELRGFIGSGVSLNTGESRNFGRRELAVVILGRPCHGVGGPGFFALVFADEIVLGLAAEGDFDSAAADRTR